MDIWPRDALAFYAAPVLIGETAFNAAVNLIVPADPDRRILIMSITGAGICAIAPTNIIPAGTGIFLVPNDPRIILTWDEHGPLVTMAWFKVLPATDTVSSISVAMRKDPRDYGYGAAYLNPSPIPERGAPAPARQRRALPRSVAHRSGLYSRFARSNPDLWE